MIGPDFHSLTADPTTLERMFAGGHQNVSVSTDNSRTWSEIEALRDADAVGRGFAGGGPVRERASRPQPLYRTTPRASSG